MPTGMLKNRPTPVYRQELNYINKKTAKKTKSVPNATAKNVRGTIVLVNSNSSINEENSASDLNARSPAPELPLLYQSTCSNSLLNLSICSNSSNESFCNNSSLNESRYSTPELLDKSISSNSSNSHSPILPPTGSVLPQCYFKKCQKKPWDGTWWQMLNRDISQSEKEGFSQEYSYNARISSERFKKMSEKVVKILHFHFNSLPDGIVMLMCDRICDEYPSLSESSGRFRFVSIQNNSKSIIVYFFNRYIVLNINLKSLFCHSHFCLIS